MIIFVIGEDTFAYSKHIYQKFSSISYVPYFILVYIYIFSLIVFSPLEFRDLGNLASYDLAYTVTPSRTSITFLSFSSLHHRKEDHRNSIPTSPLLPLPSSEIQPWRAAPRNLHCVVASQANATGCLVVAGPVCLCVPEPGGKQFLYIC